MAILQCLVNHSMESIAQMKYRAHLDGIRAIAVLAVMIFHTEIGFLPGGYLGVDIFLVISGYLIASIILSGVDEGNFRLSGFYLRRLKRIVPALVLVIAVSISVSFFLLLPDDLVDFTNSALSAGLFVSNFYFLESSDYFDTESSLKPLLHTWSLSVEMQFYAVMPLIVFALYTIKARVSICAVLILSFFVFSLVFGTHHPDASFYMMFTRLWQFLMGSFVFLIEKENRKLPAGPVGELLGLAGLVLVGFSFLYYDDTTPAPDETSLAATVGAALLIYAGQSSRILGQLLMARPLIFIGLISYSSYLWHYPIFVFSRHFFGHEMSEIHWVSAFMASLMLGALTWFVFENRYRKKEQARGFFLLALGFFALVFSFYFMVKQTNGALWRESVEHYQSVVERLIPNYGLSYKCEGVYNESPDCETSPEPDTVVWGDSFAMHIVPAIESAQEGVKLKQFTVSACGPVLGVAPVLGGMYNEEWARACMENNDNVLNWIQSNSSVRYVVMSSILVQYFDKETKLITREGEYLKGGDDVLPYVIRTLDKLKEKGIKPVWVSPTPGNGMDIGHCLKKKAFLNFSYDECDFPAENIYEDYIAQYIGEIEKQVPVIWLDEMICQNDVCDVAVDDVLIYRDSIHLSYEGSRYLGQKYNFYKRIVEQ